MSGYLRGNEDKRKEKSQLAASLFAQEVLAHVGGSCVYIEPKKTKKFVDTDKIE